MGYILYNIYIYQCIDRRIEFGEQMRTHNFKSTVDGAAEQNWFALSKITLISLKPNKIFAMALARATVTKV